MTHDTDTGGKSMTSVTPESLTDTDTGLISENILYAQYVKNTHANPLQLEDLRRRDQLL
jgi:hypothetical protein